MALFVLFFLFKCITKHPMNGNGPQKTIKMDKKLLFNMNSSSAAIDGTRKAQNAAGIQDRTLRACEHFRIP